MVLAKLEVVAEVMFFMATTRRVFRAAKSQQRPLPFCEVILFSGRWTLNVISRSVNLRRFKATLVTGVVQTAFIACRLRGSDSKELWKPAICSRLTSPISCPSPGTVVAIAPF